MKLIVVNRLKLDTYRRLLEKFADDLDVRVVWDRRRRQVRTQQEPRVPDRRRSDRRRLKKEWEGRDYFVIHVADNGKRSPDGSGS